MAIIPTLLSLLLGAAFHAGLVKLAARLYRRTKLSWKSALGCGALVLLFTAFAVVLQSVLPMAVSLVVGLAGIMAVYTLFLARRAKDASGQPIGYKAAAIISAIALGIGFAIGVVIMAVLPRFFP